MKVINLLLVVLFYMSGVVLAGENSSGTAVISGYQPREFAVKGIISEQVNILVQEVSKMANGRQMNILVSGFADKTGDTAENDEYALKRGETVKAIFANAFPEANVQSLSKGDEMNARQVVVEWTFIVDEPVVATVAEDSWQKKLGISFFACAIVLSVIMICISLIKSQNRVEPICTSKFTVDGKVYQYFPATNAKGEFLSPQTGSEKGDQLPFEDIRTLRRSVISWMKKATPEQIQELVFNGSLRQIKEAKDEKVIAADSSDVHSALG